MTFWIAFAAVAAVAGLWLARSFMQRGGVELAEGEQAISIYRDQIDAVQRDAEHGLISEAERLAAEREIEARALRAARTLDNNLLAPRVSRAAAFGVAAITIAGSGLLYGLLGAPAAPDQPLAWRRAMMMEAQAAAGVPAPAPELTASDPAETPDSFEEWWALARMRTAQGDHAAAVEAYRKAAEASGDRPSVLSAYAEALTLANGNKVPSAAKIIFGQVLAQTPRDPRARYYIALSRAQEKDFQGALADWLALYGESPPGAPWAPVVRQDIVNMARFTRTPLDQILPDATPEERALAASPPPDPASSEDRIAEIEATLAKKPKDYELSIELAQLYASSGRTDEAGAVLNAARAQYPGAPFVAQRLAETAQNLGLVPQTSPGRGPTDDDVAAAAAMTERERSDMIRGMVDGLAARLETQPDDLNGWLMLIRSYAVLQQADAANSAARRAYSFYDGKPDERAAIRATAAEFGISLM